MRNVTIAVADSGDADEVGRQFSGHIVGVRDGRTGNLKKLRMLLFYARPVGRAFLENAHMYTPLYVYFLTVIHNLPPS